MKLDIAKKNDALQISKLLNLAYRGPEGWTTESALVEGDRCGESDIISAIQSPNNSLLVSKQDKIIQACISIEKRNNKTYIGSFAVNPKIQNSGIGKKVLKLAEQYAVIHFQSDEFLMVVLSSRTELIKYYERRGYQRNGVINNYPKNVNIGTPLNPNLTIEELIKKA